MRKTTRNILFVVLGLLIIGFAGAYLYISSVLNTRFNIDKTAYIYIDQSKNYNNILLQIDTAAHVESMMNFKQVASYMKYPENIKTGRYAITPEMNIRDAIRVLQAGKQTPVRLTFNNIRTREDLAKRISEQLMFSEKELYSALIDSVTARQFGFAVETFPCMFIPNTYEIYWDIRPDSFLKRMDAEYKRFWTDSRKNKAEDINLTPVEVAILASIVEEECYFTDEYPVVAGLYLNRLSRGQLLQADPTVKYAVGDFTLRRVLNRHLETDSPYNTYKYAGLPPGPIRIPSIKGIDAVLNPSKHNYLYMCAKEDFSGRHNFAETHAEHERNANRYRAALNARRIFN